MSAKSKSIANLICQILFVIAEVVGSFTNVVGLPMETVRDIVGPAGPRGDGPLGERS